MKKINFTKMAGAGNDFLVVNPPKGLALKKLAQKACDRTNGIGADGLLILDPSKKSDYRMRIINADGTEAEMCGNGARCMAAYIAKYKKPKKELFSMETLAGEVLGKAAGEVAVVRLSNPQDYTPNITLNVNDQDLTVYYIDTGVPHTIIYVDNLAKTNVEMMGRIIRYHDHFKPRGTNANFVTKISEDLVDCRTYERGVEGETKACGTGSVAAGLVTYLLANPNTLDKKNARMKVQTKSGEILQITFDITKGQIENVWLKGSARFIASGEYYL